MATLDFSELSSKPTGENLEGLVRLIGERLGLAVSWTGRGADQGRDLIFTETQTGQIGSTPVRWLVSCKDNSKTNQSVSEQDVGSVLDKVRQHNCDGFLLATTTTVGTALKAKLDALQSNPQDPVQTRVWDRFAITSMLLSEQFADLLRQFFPREMAKNAAIEIEAARKRIEKSVPRVVVGALRLHLMPHQERLQLVRGINVWPHDFDQQTLIDQIVPKVIAQNPNDLAIRQIQQLHFDAFLAFTDHLIRSFPNDAYRHLLHLAQKDDDSSRIYNVIKILREFEQFTDEVELSVAARCDQETLWELYDDLVLLNLTDETFWDQHTLWEIERFHEFTEIKNIEADEVEFATDDGVLFTAMVHFDVYGSTDDGDNGYSGNETFAYRVTGHLESLQSIVVTDIAFRR
ncbi:restriction endonuclease [Rhodopseudomonas palustris]|uniref:restriction endonuclease n=1 Tax=Rhodopseudomonas palustris TaxID=1076 RepID=UPI001402F4DA|nr:restriction endonuclease [Rhodopseudomonas palustris]QLH71679.1 restriction endonuclease [Rhodopseudomonas palustris]